MQTFNTKKDGTLIFPGDSIVVTGTPQPAGTVNTGNASHSNTADAIASVVDNTGNGLELTIQAHAPGSTTFTMSGFEHDGVTPFSAQFGVVVSPTPVVEPTTFLFAVTA